MDKLADQQFMIDIGAVGYGVLGGEAVGYLADGHTVVAFDTPAELAGMAVIASAEYALTIDGNRS